MVSNASRIKNQDNAIYYNIVRVIFYKFYKDRDYEDSERKFIVIVYLKLLFMVKQFTIGRSENCLEFPPTLKII